MRRSFRSAPLSAIVAIVLLASTVLFALARSHDYAFSNEGQAGSDCDVAPLSTPVAGATEEAESGTPTDISDLDFLIEAVASRGFDSPGGLPDPLRLSTIRLSPETPASADISTPACHKGYFVLYVLSGSVELSHHSVDPATGVSPDSGSGIVKVGTEGDHPELSECSHQFECTIEEGKSIILQINDAAFLESAIVSIALVGEEPAVILYASVSPDWLPCSGGPCP